VDQELSVLPSVVWDESAVPLLIQDESVIVQDDSVLSKLVPDDSVIICLEVVVSGRTETVTGLSDVTEGGVVVYNVAVALSEDAVAVDEKDVVVIKGLNDVKVKADVAVDGVGEISLVEDVSNEDVVGYVSAVDTSRPDPFSSVTVDSSVIVSPCLFVVVSSAAVAVELGLCVSAVGVVVIVELVVRMVCTFVTDTPPGVVVLAVVERTGAVGA
jgi:hypothetical protein